MEGAHFFSVAASSPIELWRLFCAVGVSQKRHLYTLLRRGSIKYAELRVFIDLWTIHKECYMGSLIIARPNCNYSPFLGDINCTYYICASC